MLSTKCAAQSSPYTFDIYPNYCQKNTLYNNYMHTVYAFELTLRYPKFSDPSLLKYTQNQYMLQFLLQCNFTKADINAHLKQYSSLFCTLMQAFLFTISLGKPIKFEPFIG